MARTAQPPLHVLKLTTRGRAAPPAIDAGNAIDTQVSMGRGWQRPVTLSLGRPQVGRVDDGEYAYYQVSHPTSAVLTIVYVNEQGRLRRLLPIEPLEFSHILAVVCAIYLAQVYLLSAARDCIRCNNYL
jgi:hypothetical protein